MLKNKKYLLIILLIILLLVAYFIFQLFDITKNTGKSPNNKFFSVIVLPDTQFYAESYPDIFCTQTDWIVQNKEKLNIVFVSQLGDITNQGGKDLKQWEVASRCMGKLDGKVPYGVLPGNHDIETPHKKETGFATYTKNFPPSRFSNYSWYKGNFEDNVNNYEIVDVLDTKIMFLNMGIEPGDEALEWAGKILKENPNIYTIFTTHKYLADNSKTQENSRSYSKDGNTGLNIWNKLISKNCSIKLALSGHFHRTTGTNMLASRNTCGNSVYQVLQDYQSDINGGNGKLRIYTFIPSQKMIKISTYSPYTKTFETDGGNNFIIPFDN